MVCALVTIHALLYPFFLPYWSTPPLFLSPPFFYLAIMLTPVSLHPDLNAPSPCLKKTCEFGSSCVVKNGNAVCECSDTCLQASDPVCGNDGQTYTSQCQMNAIACTLQKHIQIKHKGPCGESIHTHTQLHTHTHTWAWMMLWRLKLQLIKLSRA